MGPICGRFCNQGILGTFLESLGRSWSHFEGMLCQTLMRGHIVQEKAALTKFFNCVDWADPEEVPPQPSVDRYLKLS